MLIRERSKSWGSVRSLQEWDIGEREWERGRRKKLKNARNRWRSSAGLSNAWTLKPYISVPGGTQWLCSLSFTMWIYVPVGSSSISRLYPIPLPGVSVREPHRALACNAYDCRQKRQTQTDCHSSLETVKNWSVRGWRHFEANNRKTLCYRWRKEKGMKEV